MRLRGTRRRRGVDRGFVLSDHADWPGLQQAIGASGAGRVIVTHGQIEPMVRWLTEQGLDAGAFATEYGDEALDTGEAGNASNVGDAPAGPNPPDDERDSAADAPDPTASTPR
jgi:putative mRNA 3-end processing factor